MVERAGVSDGEVRAYFALEAFGRLIRKREGLLADWDVHVVVRAYVTGACTTSRPHLSRLGFIRIARERGMRPIAEAENTVERLFGTVAAKAFALARVREMARALEGIPRKAPTPAKPKRLSPRRVRQANRHGVAAGLRFKVLTRDHYRCVYCGTTSAEAKLHVDHLVPFSLGGRTEIGNLAASCADCNLGKGNRHLTSLVREGA